MNLTHSCNLVHGPEQPERLKRPQSMDEQPWATSNHLSPESTRYLMPKPTAGQLNYRIPASLQQSERPPLQYSRARLEGTWLRWPEPMQPREHPANTASHTKISHIGQHRPLRWSSWSLWVYMTCMVCLICVLLLISMGHQHLCITASVQ